MQTYSINRLFSLLVVQGCERGRQKQERSTRGNTQGAKRRRQRSQRTRRLLHEVAGNRSQSRSHLADYPIPPIPVRRAFPGLCVSWPGVGRRLRPWCTGRYQ
ncbi:hypothetical protein H310_07164 [Aphanomyces invadans]|uniref:Uncharacterized protein n=1 Tax=Aphanomyces invadans TaxID=157072 RepID=A0A024U4P7_9STRA|nr:hypothetical protein H310_07164 [Aphanomyces invadans]ETW00588.1 hypothetical protein H310_07164 [Aphanomyces invadans]|eukprot:XP_008870723.1 hypothetical protein H310_07164 [Aphanomyces invadans]